MRVAAQLEPEGDDVCEDSHFIIATDIDGPETEGSRRQAIRLWLMPKGNRYAPQPHARAPISDVPKWDYSNHVRTP